MNKLVLTDKVRLTSASGHNLKVLGKASLVANKRDDKKVNLIVIESNKKFFPLLGRNWLDILTPSWREALVNKVVCIDDQEKIKIKSYVKLIEKDYAVIFKKSLEEPMKHFEAQIKVREGSTPIFCKSYDVPFKLKDKVSEEIDRLVREGIIRQVKYSDWASPVVVVKKKDGSVRLCMDCKVSVNKVIETEHYPLPNINDLLANLPGFKFLSTIDLTGAYQQIPVAEESRKYLRINTFKGLYEFVRLPFGISSSASIFQQIIDEILRDVGDASAFLDDIITGGNTVEQCWENTRKVLDKLKEFKVKVNWEKSQFFVKEVEYLGHVISGEGIRPSEKKLEAIKEAPRPTNVTQLQAFLGLINFYRKFVPNMSMRLAPLLSKSSNWVWSQECEECFEVAKLIMCADTVLAHYDPTKPLRILCDASQDGVGAMLCIVEKEVEKPVFYVSSTLSDAERNYPNLHREALAVVYAIKKFHKYIYGNKFTVITDHRPLTGIFGKEKNLPSLIAARLQRFVYMVSMYDFDIKYREGKKMLEADYLSRSPIKGKTGIDEEEEICMKQIHSEFPVNFKEVEIETQKDKTLARLYQLIREGFLGQHWDSEIKFLYKNQEKLSIQGGCILFLDRVMIPYSLRGKILNLLHSCHAGISRMKNTARAYVYWIGLDKDIEEFVNSCTACATVVSKRKREFHEWEATEYPFERVHLDFFHFESENYLIFVDSFSKWVEIIKMKDTRAEKVIGELEKIFSIFGIAKLIVTDNGPPFDSFKLKEFCLSKGILLVHSPPYHPQSNGLAERAVQTAKLGLRKLRQDMKWRYADMNVLIDKLLFEFRNTFLPSINGSPAQKLFRYKPRKLIENILPESKKSNKFLQSVPEKISQNIVQARNSNLTNSMKKFKINDLIWYKNSRERYARKARIVRENSGCTFYIELEEGRILLAHLNQMKLRTDRNHFGIVSPREIRFPVKRKAITPLKPLRRSQRQRRAPDRLEYRRPN